jgi:hypothetical protein
LLRLASVEHAEKRCGDHRGAAATGAVILAIMLDNEKAGLLSVRLSTL